MHHEVNLVDTALVYLKQDATEGWHPPMAVQCDFTLVKAYDDNFAHFFPDTLTGCIFTQLKQLYVDRDHLHVIQRDKSTSFSMNGVTYCEKTKWGAGFSPNSATLSRLYRECFEENVAWLDADSHILYYTQNAGEYCYNGIGRVFGGSNSIPTRVRCSEHVFSEFLREIRSNYIGIACNSAVVCLLRDGVIDSTHKGVDGLRPSSKRKLGCE
jgi:hypothetical protein